MRRVVVLGLLLAAGLAGVLHAQRAGRGGANTVAIEQVKPNLWVLRGGGGNTAVFVMSDGVAVVDAKNPGWGQPILDSIRTLTDKPVTLLINTHAHGDHVSGNVEFPASVEVVAQANTKANMEKMPIFAEHGNVGLPKRTFTDRLTIGEGADRIDLYYFGPGHTNGDAWIAFPSLGVVHSGDIFAGKAVPLVDEANGGSMLHIADTLAKAHEGIPDVTTIVNGHTPANTTWDDLAEYAAFNRELVAWMQAELRAGKTPEQAAAEWKLPEKYAGYSGNVGALFGGLAGRIATLQREMQR